MPSASAQITTTPTNFPAGTSISYIIARLMNGSTVVASATADASGSASFPNVQPGTYTIQAQAMNSAGVGVGAAVASSPFTVTQPPVSLNIPTAVTVTVS